MPLSILKMMNSQQESVKWSILGRTDGYLIRIKDFTKANKQTLCQAPCPPVYLPYEYIVSILYTNMMTQNYCFHQQQRESSNKNFISNKI